MGLFSKKKTEDKKKDDDSKEPVKVDSGKKEPKKQSMKDLYADKAGMKKEEKDGQEGPSAGSGQAKEGEKGKKVEGIKKVRRYGDAHKVLVKPLVTEKASNLGALNKYVFAVARGANKIAVAKAMEEVYGIKPVSVNIIKMKGKNVRYGRARGRKKDWKKAIITLPAGTSIKIYEGV